MKVAVIIPFYQKKRGLLRLAVDSIYLQKVNAELYVIVVDDGSPLPAREELGEFRDWDNLIIVKQKNAGAGAARNAGLDHVPEDTDYVAFLDSDDVWKPGHLQRAVTALQQTGADLFFENAHYQSRGVLFERLEIRNTLSQLGHKLDDHFLFVSSSTNDWFPVVLNGCITTPVVVIRRGAIGMMRFPKDYYRLGEDQKFWLEIGFKGRGFVYSNCVGATYGSGVNIYSGGQWGSVSSLHRKNHEIRYRKDLLKDERFPGLWQCELQHRLATARKDMILLILHHLKRGRIKLCLAQMWDDPALLFLLPSAIVRSLRT